MRVQFPPPPFSKSTNFRVFLASSLLLCHLEKQNFTSNRAFFEVFVTKDDTKDDTKTP